MTHCLWSTLLGLLSVLSTATSRSVRQLPSAYPPVLPTGYYGQPPLTHPTAMATRRHHPFTSLITTTSLASSRVIPAVDSLCGSITIIAAHATTLASSRIPTSSSTTMSVSLTV
uniref:IP14334p n=1 Tax=Drosophila melanogaster TaxID=7227 RepID=D0IQE8_DROME|nr:IP14334p [Drosophila melanogaster]